jgi:hypothetical protein
MKNIFENPNIKIMTGEFSAEDKYNKLYVLVNSKEEMKELNSAFEKSKEGNLKPLNDLYLEKFPDTEKSSIHKTDKYSKEKPKPGSEVDIYV